MTSMRISFQRWLVAVMAVSMLMAQALWLLHRVAHSGVQSATYSASGFTARLDARQNTGALAKALLPQHDDERSCAAYDLLAHTDLAPGGTQLDLTQAHCLAIQTTHAASRLAAQAAGYLARGPPELA
jgi:hypothetical protein